MRRLPIKNEPWGRCSVRRALGLRKRPVPLCIIAASIALTGAVGSFPARGVAHAAPIEEAVEPQPSP